MAIDKLNSLQFLFLRTDYFQEFGDRDGVCVVRWVCRAMDRQLGTEGEATGTIDGFIHALDAQPGMPMSIEDMGKIAAAGWASELCDREDKA